MLQFQESIFCISMWKFSKQQIQFDLLDISMPLSEATKKLSSYIRIVESYC